MWGQLVQMTTGMRTRRAAPDASVNGLDYMLWISSSRVSRRARMVFVLQCIQKCLDYLVGVVIELSQSEDGQSPFGGGGIFVSEEG